MGQVGKWTKYWIYYELTLLKYICVMVKNAEDYTKEIVTSVPIMYIAGIKGDVCAMNRY